LLGLLVMFFFFGMDLGRIWGVGRPLFSLSLIVSLWFLVWNVDCFFVFPSHPIFSIPSFFFLVFISFHFIFLFSFSLGK